MKGRRYIVVFITTPPGKGGAKIANFLIRRRLSACVNIVPVVSSIYRWKGKVETARESLLIIKTRGAVLKRLIAEVRKVHPYTVPEIISLPIPAGHKDYLRWVDENTRTRS